MKIQKVHGYVKLKQGPRTKNSSFQSCLGFCQLHVSVRNQSVWLGILYPI